jgi:penicillin-binding protein A
VNKQLRRLGVGLIVCYVILFAQLNWLHVVKADSYNSDPRNDREIIRDFTRPRGAILTADGVVVARSVPSNDRFKLQREYPTSDLFAGVGGYFSFVYGTDGVERQYNDVLAGQTPQQKLRGFANLFNDEVNTGDVQLTLRNDIQTVAKEALGDKEGSVVVTDPRTGAILAMYSNPTYDPNTIATHDFDAAKVARDALLANPSKPLLMNAYQER